MFVDGLMYSSISRNLAEGQYGLFNLHYAEFNDPLFQNQPPLSFWMQSIFFYIFGDSLLIERFFGLIMLIVNSIIIIKIWNYVKPKNSENKFLPLIFVISIPIILWGTANNMIENSLSVFINLSFYYQLKFTLKENYLYIFLSALAVLLGILTKGFYALFPLSFMFFYWIIFKKHSIIKTLLILLLQFSLIAIPLLLLYNFHNEFRTYSDNYINNQFLKSIFLEEDSRFFIIKRFVSELIPSFSIIIIVLLISFFYKIKSSIKINRYSILFLLIGLTGVIPITISTKQSGYYIIPAYWSICIFFSLIIVEYTNKITLITLKAKRKYFNILFATIFLLTIITSYITINTNQRDKIKIADIDKVIELINDEPIISISEDLYYDWPLHGYFMRFAKISLDKDSERKYKLISLENQKTMNYKTIKKLDNYILLEKISE